MYIKVNITQEMKSYLEDLFMFKDDDYDDFILECIERCMQMDGWRNENEYDYGCTPED